MAASAFYSYAPPKARTTLEDRPTLLVSWWCTGFAFTVIIIRLACRLTRLERLILEDKIMALALIPLFLRMGLVHVVLLWGTNNTVTAGLSELDIHRRSIGSRAVLAARIMYAATLWVQKYSIAETLNRFVSRMFRPVYERCILILRWFLLLSFLAVVTATLGECLPFHRYWQVVPDPGPRCRLAYGQLGTMGALNIITDLVLVILPVPIIIQSHLPVRRKCSLFFLFGLSLAPVAMTLFRIPTLLDKQGSQQYRSLCASLEILIATGATNTLALGSFVRDRGPKKKRFRFGSATDSLSRPSTRRDVRHVSSPDSDVGLARSIGMYMEPELESAEVAHVARPASITVSTRSRPQQKRTSAPVAANPKTPTPEIALALTTEDYEEHELHNWPLSSKQHDSDHEPDDSDPDCIKVIENGAVPLSRQPNGAPVAAMKTAAAHNNTMATASPPAPPPQQKRLSFFDVGGLWEDSAPSSRSITTTPIIDLYAGTSSPTSSVLAGPYSVPPTPDMAIRQYGGFLPSSPRHTGSKVLLQDIGGLLSTTATTKASHAPPGVAANAGARQHHHHSHQNSAIVAPRTNVPITAVTALATQLTRGRHQHRQESPSVDLNKSLPNTPPLSSPMPDAANSQDANNAPNGPSALATTTAAPASTTPSPPATASRSLRPLTPFNLFRQQTQQTQQQQRPSSSSSRRFRSRAGGDTPALPSSSGSPESRALLLPRSHSLPLSISQLPKNCEPLRDVGGLLNRMDDDADGSKNGSKRVGKGSKRDKKSSPDENSPNNNHNLTITTKASS